jgi:hypothetical protein
MLGETRVKLPAGAGAGITPELLDNLAETHRNRIRPFCTNGTLGIRRVVPSIPKDSSHKLFLWDESSSGFNINGYMVGVGIIAIDYKLSDGFGILTIHANTNMV